ncbi:hypothetical protein [Epilithonimonas sp. UC225_85]|uniref:hypothetical protein n=1 Tax=Epilithonimonas sp. UC225_85 TaxID=3350167 RepID=UPI0036D2943D
MMNFKHNMMTPEDIENLVGKPKHEIENLFGETEFEDPYEHRYVLRKYCFGLFVKRLYLYFDRDNLNDYYIGIL